MWRAISVYMHVMQPASMFILLTCMHTINAIGWRETTSCICACVVCPSSYCTLRTTMMTIDYAKMWTSGVVHAPLDNIIPYIYYQDYTTPGVDWSRCKGHDQHQHKLKGMGKLYIYHCPEPGPQLDHLYIITLLHAQCRYVCYGHVTSFTISCASCNDRHQEGALWDHRRGKRCTEL